MSDVSDDYTVIEYDGVPIYCFGVAKPSEDMLASLVEAWRARDNSQCITIEPITCRCRE